MKIVPLKGPLKDHYLRLIKDAAGALIAIADDSGRDLVSVIAEMERYIVEETKVGDAAKEPVPSGRLGYTLKDGRLIRCRRKK